MKYDKTINFPDIPPKLRSEIPSGICLAILPIIFHRHQQKIHPGFFYEHFS